MKNRHFKLAFYILSKSSLLTSKSQILYYKYKYECLISSSPLLSNTVSFPSKCRSFKTSCFHFFPPILRVFVFIYFTYTYVINLIMHFYYFKINYLLRIKFFHLYLHPYLQFLAVLIPFNRPEFLYSIIFSLAEEFPLIFFWSAYFLETNDFTFSYLKAFILPAFLNGIFNTE